MIVLFQKFFIKLIAKVIKKTKQQNFIRNNLSQKVINETFQIH